MKHKLVAYLMRDNGQVSDMPTEELVVALDQLMQASTAQGQGMSSDIVAGYEFLQTVKLAMQTSKGRVSSETFVKQADTLKLTESQYYYRSTFHLICTFSNVATISLVRLRSRSL